MCWNFNPLPDRANSNITSMHFRLATLADIPQLLPLMQDFYLFEKLSFDAGRLTSSLETLITDERLGRVVLIELDSGIAGYLILTFGYSLEFHGLDALLDEFYISPAHRNNGIGSAALDYAYSHLKSLGIAALHLEADHFNERGHSFYKRQGFRDHERHLMTKWL